MTNIINLIGSVYVRESPLEFTHGKFHEYLVMKVYFYNKGKVKFTIYDYISNMLEDLPKDTRTGE